MHVGPRPRGLRARPTRPSWGGKVAEPTDLPLLRPVWLRTRPNGPSTPPSPRCRPRLRDRTGNPWKPHPFSNPPPSPRNRRRELFTFLDLSRPRMRRHLSRLVPPSRLIPSTAPSAVGAALAARNPVGLVRVSIPFLATSLEKTEAGSPSLRGRLESCLGLSLPWCLIVDKQPARVSPRPAPHASRAKWGILIYRGTEAASWGSLGERGCYKYAYQATGSPFVFGT